MAVRYLESYGQYDDDDPPASLYIGDWEDEDLLCDDELWEYEYRRSHTFSLYYDRSKRRWECSCLSFLRKGTCVHSRRLRKEEVINVDEAYL